MPVEIAELVALADRLVERAGLSLAEAENSDEIFEMMGRLNAAVEGELGKISPPGENFLTACSPGCHSCCVVNVSVLVPEAVAIAAYLQKTLPKWSFSGVKAKIDRQAEKVRWVDDQERPRLRLPCAFLDERGWCMIHLVRPFLCRSVSSNDPKACEMISTHGEAEVMMDLPQKILCSMVFTDLARILQQQGMDCRSLELNRMVGNLLDRPSLVQDFLARKRLEFR